jgi:adenylyltransferase/sulfurtransferase
MEGTSAIDRERYSRQILFSGIGEEGQRRLSASTAVVVGCGALGSVIANSLARAGVGRLIIADRDVIRLHNLHRQVLYDEEDVARGLHKAEAAAEKLRRINSAIRIEAVVEEVRRENVEALIRGADVVLDGTDNFATRYLINDACLKNGIPWVYGGVVRGHGLSMTILPGRTPCLRCLYAEPPSRSAAETADTAGVLGPIVSVIASIEAAEAMKLLTGRGQINPGLIAIDLWASSYEQITIPGRADNCPACGRGIYEFLVG